MKRVDVFLLLLCVVFWPASANAVTVCHDYTLWDVTGSDYNKTNVASLRQRLKSLGYRRFPISPINKTAEVSKRLRAGDVLIFGEKHSGVVQRFQTIHHFTQEKGKVGRAYSPEQAKKRPGFKKGNLKEIRGYSYRMPEGQVIRPYQNVKIELWRPQTADLTGRWTTNHGPASLQREGTYYYGTVKYSNGNSGKFYGNLKHSSSSVHYVGTWHNGADRGTFKLKVEPSGQSMRGTWKSARGQSGSWNFRK